MKLLFPLPVTPTTPITTSAESVLQEGAIAELKTEAYRFCDVETPRERVGVARLKVSLLSAVPTYSTSESLTMRLGEASIFTCIRFPIAAEYSQ